MEFFDVVVWAGFLAFVLTLLALDLGVFHREVRAIRSGEALAWAAFYVSLALCFNGLVYLLYENNWLGVGESVGHPLDGKTAALQFLTGYLLEQSLSLDNVFVIALIFGYFRIPLAYQHRVLFWGILGALIMRGLMIALGAALISRFDWVVYVFGGILIVTAARMLMAGDEEPEPDKNWLVRIARRFFPVAPELHGEKFFIHAAGRRVATPLFLVLLMVESTDVLFAVDSIPAIFAVTQDPFLVFTSNVFAILGLRNLYFAIAPLLNRFKYLKQSLVFILAFVGVKMLLSHTYPIPTQISLSMIVGILAVGVLASAFAAGRAATPLATPAASDPETLTRMTLESAHKLILLVLGSTVFALAALAVILPARAIVLPPLALLAFGTELWWGRRLLARLRAECSIAGSACRDAAAREASSAASGDRRA